MMRYALLCHFNERAWSDIPPAERDVIMERYHAVIDELHREGRHRLSSQLDSVTEATALRSGPRSDGSGRAERPLTDGPFVETKEHLGGFHIIEAANLDEAIEIASRIPTLPAGGTVEVRPLAS